MLPIDHSSRQAPENRATVVAPEQSVRPLKEVKDLRNKDRHSSSQDQPETSGQGDAGKDSAAVPATPDFYLQGVDPDSGRIYLKAVDPKTGYVYWQVPRPSSALPGSAETQSADPTQAAEAAVEKTGKSAGLLGNRAYGSIEPGSDDSHRIDKTA